MKSAFSRLPKDIGFLPRTVRPFPAEPASSVLHRLAIANGYASTKLMKYGIIGMRDLGPGAQQAKRMEVDLAAKLTGSCLQELEAETPINSGRGLMLRGTSFGRFSFSNAAKVCPLCLIEDLENGELGVHRRAWWSLPAINTCHIHSVRLISRCPQCEKLLQMEGSPQFCSSPDMCDVTTLLSYALEEDDLVHDRWLLGRLGYAEQIENSFLEDLSLDIGSRLCALVGAIKLNRTDRLGKLSQSLRYNMECRNVGWEEICSWPENLGPFLDKALAKAEAHSGFGSHHPAPFQVFRNFILHHELKGLVYVIEKMGYRLGLGDKIERYSQRRKRTPRQQGALPM